MKHKILSGLVSAISVFALTACGGGGIFAGTYGDYIDSVKGKVVTNLVYYDDPTTEEDESANSANVQWYKYSEQYFTYDVDNTPILHDNYVHGKIEDGFEIKESVDGRVQSHLIIDVQHNGEKEKILNEQKTPADVFIVNAYAFDRDIDEMYYHQIVKNEETILYEIESTETPDVIGDMYSTYFVQFYTFLESFYDVAFVYGDINDLKPNSEASDQDSIFAQMSWDVNKYVDYKTPLYDDLGERLFVKSKLTPCEQLNMSSIIGVFSASALFFKELHVYNLLGELLMSYFFDIKEWNGGQDIRSPEVDTIAPEVDSQPDPVE